jgi:hypothetical protein
MKKYLFIVLLLSIVLGSDAYSQWRPYGVPSYIRAGYFEDFPDFYKFPINGRIRYYEPTAEDLKYVPNETRFLSNDGIEVVNVSSSFPNAKTETWMAINPNNPDNLIATCNDNAFLGGFQGFRMSAFVSKDGGRNWTHNPTPSNSGQWFSPTGTQATIFDPGVGFDLDGNAYYIYGFSETTWGSEDKDTEKNGVFVVKSTNGGSTWDALTNGSPNGIVAITTDAFKTSGNPFHDRYTIGIDNSTTSPYKNNVYVTWRVFRGQDGVVFSKSSDGGESWSPYRKLASNGQAPQPVTGPDGEVYVTWIDVDFNGSSRALFIKSTDGGNSFGSVAEAQRVSSVGDRHATSGRFVLKNKQDIRVSSVPQMASDNSNSPYRGNIYIVQAGRETTGGLYGIYLSKSTNKGSTWTKNIRIDNSLLRNDMFFPSIACDPMTGLISVLYYSSQNDNTNVGVDAYVALSNDGGETWKHLRVSPTTVFLNNQNTVMPQGGAGNIYWGDYTHIVSYNNKVYPLYWASTANDFRYYSTALFTALISPAPQQPFSPDFLTLQTPTSLKISWLHPTKNLLGENLGQFKINIYKGETKIGEVANSSTPEFVDNNVTYGESITYYLETEVPEGLKSSKTVVNAIVGGNPKPKAPSNLTWRPSPNGITLNWINPAQTIANEPLLDGLKVAVYNAETNELIETFGSSEFIAGEGASHTVTLETEKFYKLNIKTVAVRGTVETESDFSDNVVIAYAGVPKEDFNETYDEAQNRVPIYIEGKWGITTAKSSSAPNSFTDSPDGNYSADQNEYFILAPLVLSSGKSTISFDHIALIDTVVRQDINGNPAYDYGEIAYSLDFGATWKLLKWVNASTSENFILNNLEASQWQNLAFNLSEFNGDTVLFKFTLGSNNFRQTDGWYLDNILIDGRPSSVNYDLYESSIISVNPNPVQNIAKVSLRTAVDADLRIELFDVLGNKIISDNLGFITQGNYTFDYNMNELSNGMYYYRISIGNYTRTIPVSLTR